LKPTCTNCQAQILNGINHKIDLKGLCIEMNRKSTLFTIAALLIGLMIGYVAGKGQVDHISFTPSDELAGSRYEWVVDDPKDGDSFDARLKSVDGVDLFNLNIVYGVRIVGINTPERGECGFDVANAKLEELMGSKPFFLISGGTENESDGYGRLLRYVELNGTDVGLTLIEQGLAVAAYDSFDIEAKVGPHDRENEYRSADKVSENLCP
jgi:endonuclease YncB( thermonuclease family)